jgi:DNA-directed RNA polymerase subunit RPC12/RpoP
MLGIDMTYKCPRCDSENCDDTDGWVKCLDCRYRWKSFDRPVKPVKAYPNYCDKQVID